MDFRNPSNAMKQGATRDELNAYFQSIPPDKRRLVRSLRALVRRTIPRTEETLLWGGLSYHRPEIGGRVKGAVCLIGIRDDRVELAFIHGVRLPDPRGLLRGTRKSKRSVPITKVADVRQAGLASLIREAAAITWD
jgi:hypothetical protein